MGRISKKTVEQVKDRAQIDEVAEKIGGLKLTKAGTTQKCRCPFHEEKSASFTVNARRNTAHCFGCGWHGDSIKFVMDKEGVGFGDAVRRLADLYGIEVVEERPPMTDAERNRHADEERERERKERAMIITEEATRLFCQLLEADTPAAKAANDYARQRWGAGDSECDFIHESRIGYGGSGHDLEQHLRLKGYSLDTAVEIGLLRWDSHDHAYYEPFAHRLTIPICEKYHRTIAFTARDIEGKSKAKYINSGESFLYHKGATLFGLDTARGAARRERKIYLVEGAPDVLKLQEVGVFNAVAPLGTALTDDQLKLIDKDWVVCFVPDNDEIKGGRRWGTGFDKVMANGRKAVEAGYNVTIREIPAGKGGAKEDCDSYVHDISNFNSLQEMNFPVWYASLVLSPNDSDSEQARKIAEICQLLPKREGLELETILDTLGQMTEKRTRSYWQKAYASVMREQQQLKAERVSSDDKEERDLLKKYGFYEEDHCYYSINGKEGKQWSNFTMKPLMHIEENGDAIRLFEICNRMGKRRTIELQQADLVSLARFQQQVEARGNYIWMGSLIDLFRLKEYLYTETKTATIIRQLGWQKRYHFWAWNNGIYKDGRFYPVEDIGIVKIKDDERYYLPGASNIHAGETERFQFERKFNFETNTASVTMGDYCQRMEGVFGRNTLIGISYMLTSMFYDIVVARTVNFPLLNLFGPKGSGKSEFGSTLMSFFIRDNRPANVQNGTIPGMAQTIAQSANALCHIDEYKNNIGPEKNELLKGIYDRVGRTRMKIGAFGEKEATKVDQGVILSGQEMPTADIALFSRTIFLSFESSVHTPEQKRKFNELAAIRTLGVQHLVHAILNQRQLVESEFERVYDETLKELDQLNSADTEDRIWRNWTLLLATYKILREPLGLPWEIDKMKQAIADGIRTQNDACTSGNEMGVFWRTFSVLIAKGAIFSESDYLLKSVKDLTTKTHPKGFTWDGQPHPVLMVFLDHVIAEYQEQCRKDGNKAMDRQTIDFYIQHSPGYLGKKSTPMRHKQIIKGVVQTRESKNDYGMTEIKPVTLFHRPECFDYRELRSVFGLDLGEGCESNGEGSEGTNAKEQTDDCEVF